MITNSRHEPLRYTLPADFAIARRAKLSAALNDQIDETRSHGFEPSFIGPTGTGKTFALLAIRHELRGIFVDWPEFLADVRQFYSMQTEDAYWFDPVRWASANVRHLMLDDVGAERDVTGHDVAIFDRVVRARASLGSPLSFTSNLTERQLQDRYGFPVLSRLGRMCHLIELAGDDRRLERA